MYDSSHFPVSLSFSSVGRRRRAEDDLLGEYVVQVYGDRVVFRSVTERLETARALELLARVIERRGRRLDLDPLAVDWHRVERQASRLADVETALLALCDEADTAKK